MTQALKEYEIEICRASVGFATAKVRARNQLEAEAQALECAGDLEFSSKDAEYSLPAGRLADRPVDVAFQVKCSGRPGGHSPIVGVVIRLTHRDLVQLEARARREGGSEKDMAWDCPEYLTTEGVYAPWEAAELVVDERGVSVRGQTRSRPRLEMASAPVATADLLEAMADGARTVIVTADAQDPLGFLDRARRSGWFPDQDDTVVLPCGAMAPEDYQRWLDGYLSRPAEGRRERG